MMDELSRWYENMTYQEAKDILREKLDYMKKNFIAAGYYMKYIRDHELFREDRYESIWEFAEDNYGIKKSTASRWMSMNDKFSQGGNSPILAEEFRDFEKSQLQEMLYLDDKQIESVTPDMTVKEIREVRKPADRQRELKKPDETDREYLNAAAKKLIKSLRKWFLRDYTNRVLLVDKSPEEIKRELGKDHRYWHFPTENGLASINLFDDYVQIWDENYECIGEFEWFYLAAAIQAMWNNVSLEMAQEAQISESEEKTSPIDRGCIAGKNPNGNCVCCGKDDVECCGQCDDDCNSRCGWIDSAVAMSQQQEEAAEYIPGKCMHNPELACSLSEEAMRTPGTGEGNCGEVCCWECPKEDCKLRCNASEKREDREAIVATSQQVEAEPVAGMNPPEEESDSEPEVINEENVEVVDARGEELTEELYEEASDQSDIDLLQEELEKAKNTLDLMLSCYSENDIRVRKQKLLVGALTGMLCNLDTGDIPEPQQQEPFEVPFLKNNDQRKEFLNRYQVWPIWFEVPEASEVYHRLDLPDGSSIVICEYHMWLNWKERYSDENPDSIGTRKYLLRPGYHYLEDCKTNTTALVEHLKKVQKEGK